MNPIYKFELNDGNLTQRAFPIYNDDLAKDFEKESGEEFFRAKLSGSLRFESADYDFIVTKAFDTQFKVEIFISYNGGQTWASYWVGTFWKTDCEFDGDTRSVTVKPTVSDRYNEVLAGLEKEFNLIDLAPEMMEIKADKRPMVQVYIPGQSVIGCFLSGMWWEQECTAESDESKLSATGNGKLNFSLCKTNRILAISGSMSPQLPDVVNFQPSHYLYYDYTSGDFRYVCEWSGVNVAWSVIHIPSNMVYWRYYGDAPGSTTTYSVTLSPVSGTPATGNVTINVSQLKVYARYICDTPDVGGTPTYTLPTDDIVPDNRNYSHVIGYYFPDTIYFSNRLTPTPTQWGLYQPGQYYQQPYLYWSPELFPVARNAWGRISVWFAASDIDYLVEQNARQPFMIRHAYPLASVISVLLAKVAPGVTHAANTTYSQFLYGNNLVGITQTLAIVPKSNIVTAGYDQPAQKAPITLKDVLNMLRDCFRCYWFIDDQNRFRVEHIQYFRNGGSYSGTPVVGVDLTAEIVTRNGKKWSFARDQYSFDKPEMAARYQFGWMDDVTQLFEGYPIDILSKYVNPDNIEQISIAKFTSDIDYILLNPEDISKDGFVLLAAVLDSGQYVLPYSNIVIGGNDHRLQNALVSFAILQQYYAYDMPAYNYEIHGEQYRAEGIKKLKKQTIRFPLLNDPNLVQLVKTTLGNGMIEKLSLNLSSRNANATLKYDTE